MLIREEALAHFINSFYGYGSWDAPVWFVSHEDGGGDLPESVAEKLDYFHHRQTAAELPTLCDIREAYRSFTQVIEPGKVSTFANLFEMRFGKDAVHSSIWKNLILFAHGYRNETLKDTIAYQRSAFASALDPHEALIKLYPLPSPHNHAWYYSWLDLSPQFKFLKSRELYEAKLFAQRVDTIIKKITEHKPSLVLMYGMTNINDLKKSFSKFFPSVRFQQVKATKLEIPQHHWAHLEGTRVVITTQIPALRHNRPETGFNWKAFGQFVRQYRS